MNFKKRGTQGSKQNRPIARLLKSRPYLPYIAPAFFIMTVLTVFPTIFLYVISVTNYQLGWDIQRISFVGLQNFIRLLSGADPDFWHAVYISLKFMLLTTSIQMVLGFLIGKLLSDSQFRLKPVVFSLMIIPIVMMPTIAGNIWKLMLNFEYGVINYFLNRLGFVSVSWLDAKLSFYSVMLADIWQWTPFVTLIMYAGMCSLPNEQYEAARIDGAGPFNLFRYITLPNLRPLLFIALIFRTVDSLKIYDMPFVLTQGGPGNATEFLSLHVYRLANAQNGLIGRAAANAIILMLLSTTVSRLLLRWQRGGES